jgi:hypothetical protein
MREAIRDPNEVTLSGFLFLLAMAYLMWTLKREKALIPLLITTCYMPLGQAFVVVGLHFQLYRVLLIVGWIRILTRKENSAFTFTKLDRVFVYWAVATLILGTLAEPSVGRLTNRAGEVYNAFGAYFLIRCWLRSLDEVIGLVKFLSWMIVPLAVSMVVEKSTTRNIFAVFGGVPEVTLVRDGKLRCQGAFRHPILTGTYAATLYPLFVGLWTLGGKNRLPALVGTCAAAVVTVAAASSGALLAIISATVGFALWPFRHRMHLLRRGMVLTIIALALVMNAPVWFLISKVSDITGGTGWHRSYLIDQAVKHFDEWWLVGSTYTAHWAPAGQLLEVDQKNMDITNNYIAEGLGGGMVKLGLFIAMIVIGFKSVGRWGRLPEGRASPQRLMIWSLGVCLCAHCVSFISVSYFDQIIVMWYWLLANFAMLLANYPAIARPILDSVQTQPVVSPGGDGL